MLNWVLGREGPHLQWPGRTRREARLNARGRRLGCAAQSQQAYHLQFSKSTTSAAWPLLVGLS